MINGRKSQNTWPNDNDWKFLARDEEFLNCFRTGPFSNAGAPLRRSRRACRSARLESLSSPLKIGEKRRKGYAEAFGDPGDIFEAKVAFAAFDGTHECPVDATAIGKTFL